MTVRMTASVGNLAKLAATLTQADVTSQRIIRQTTYAYGKRHLRLARKLCPVGKEAYRRGEHEHIPGFLRSQLKLFIEQDGLVSRVGWKDADFREKGEPPYFRFTERGTKKMKARPCVTPARDQIRPEFVRALGANTRGGLRRMRRAR
jgi:HK97 gp10 family phage protein